jgi:hypothetical protein
MHTQMVLSAIQLPLFFPKGESERHRLLSHMLLIIVAWIGLGHGNPWRSKHKLDRVKTAAEESLKL